MKKIFLFLGVCLMLLSTTALTFADTENEDPYKAIVDKYNALYDVALVYDKVDLDNVSLENYEDTICALAKAERETLDYIALREKNLYVPAFDKPTISTQATTTKTVENEKSAYTVNNNELTAKSYKIKYKYYTKYNPSHTPTKWVAVKSGSTPTVRVPADNFASYGFTRSSFSTKYLDSQRIIGLTVKGTLRVNPYSASQGSYTVSGITLYTEFGYIS